MYDPGLGHAAEGILAAVGGRRRNVLRDLAVHRAHRVRGLELWTTAPCHHQHVPRLSYGGKNVSMRA